MLALLPLLAAMHATGNRSVAADRLVAAARAALPSARAGVDERVKVIGAPGTVWVPDGIVKLRAESPRGRWPRARVAVPVRILVHGRVAARVTVWFAIRATTRAMVFAQDEPMGTSSARVHVMQGTVDLAQMLGAPMGKMTQLRGLRLRRAVRSGMPVTRSDFETIPAVDDQARVDVKVHVGRIHMDVQGRALAEGEVGDVIPVQVQGATASVRARVVGKGVVDVLH